MRTRTQGLRFDEVAAKVLMAGAEGPAAHVQQLPYRVRLHDDKVRAHCVRGERAHARPPPAHTMARSQRQCCLPRQLGQGWLAHRTPRPAPQSTYTGVHAKGGPEVGNPSKESYEAYLDRDAREKRGEGILAAMVEAKKREARWVGRACEEGGGALLLLHQFDAAAPPAHH